MSTGPLTTGTLASEDREAVSQDKPEDLPGPARPCAALLAGPPHHVCDPMTGQLATVSTESRLLATRTSRLLLEFAEHQTGPEELLDLPSEDHPASPPDPGPGTQCSPRARRPLPLSRTEEADPGPELTSWTHTWSSWIPRIAMWETRYDRPSQREDASSFFCPRTLPTVTD